VSVELPGGTRAPTRAGPPPPADGPPTRRGARTALERAAAAGMTTSVDASSAAPLREAGATEFLGWIAGVDLLFANRDEAVVLVGEHPGDALGRRVGASCRAAVVKLGAAGATWSDGTDEAHVAADRTSAVDTTGAGDAFAAGFLAAWLQGGPPASALAAGARLAALAVSRLGGRPPR